MVDIFLGISLVLNVFLIWYITQLIKRFLVVSDELENLFVYLEEYSEHVDIVYKLERFYGDPTLENLMRHSKSVSTVANKFRSLYDVNFEEEMLEEEDYE